MLIPSVAIANPDAVDLNFIDEDIRFILHTLATMSQVDMIIDDSVKGNLTIKLNHVPLRTAIQTIMLAKGLSYEQVDHTYIIHSAEIGVTKVMKLRNTRAVDIKKTVEPIASSLKVKIETDDISNTLIMSGSPASCMRIETVVADIDVHQQQVLLEAKVVAITKSNMKDVGLDWSWDVTPQYPTSSSDGKTTTITRTANKGTIQYGRSPTGIAYEFYYQAKINALISTGNAKILANPKVTTINSKEATILIGDKIPVLTETMADGKTSTTITYIDAGIKLIYTPSITEDGNITATIHTEVSTPTLVADIKNYRITTREARSTVCMKNGETMMIAGLLGSEEAKTNNKIPLLSEIPIMGKIFQSVHNAKSETEVVIFVTAHIIP